jgi:cell wall-associated NlpC family hydrolase
MVYKINGIKLNRDADQQALQGQTLSFIEESEAGDLAFFDNDEGKINHVGLLLENHHIIHAHGTVRIDRIDQYGIFNLNKQTHTHKLRYIKKMT